MSEEVEKTKEEIQEEMFREFMVEMKKKQTADIVIASTALVSFVVLLLITLHSIGLI